MDRLDIRLRILRRILEIGSSEKHCIEAIFSSDGDTHIYVHDKRAGYAVVDSYDKRDNLDETSAFSFLDEWSQIIRRERSYGTH